MNISILIFTQRLKKPNEYDKLITIGNKKKVNRS